MRTRFRESFAYGKREETKMGWDKDIRKKDRFYLISLSDVIEISHFLRPPFPKIPSSQGLERLSQNPAATLDIWKCLNNDIKNVLNELKFL